jgi:predicted RNase H-like HicB family nuclease
VGKRTKESMVVQEQGYRYEVDIFWSGEDGCFIACVPDLDNCAAWGMTYEQALVQAHTAIRADLASRRTLGDPIPDPTPRVLA